MKAEKTSRSMFTWLLGFAVLFLAFGCSAGKEPVVNQNPPTVEELRAEWERAHYAAGAKSFAAAQERIALYTREEAERREARRADDEKRFWEKQRRARQ